MRSGASARWSKKKVRRAAPSRISDKNPEPLLRSIDEGETVEPEGYLDMAVTEWLPRGAPRLTCPPLAEWPPSPLDKPVAGLS